MKKIVPLLNVHIYKPEKDYLVLTQPETRTRMYLSDVSKKAYLFLLENEGLSIDELIDKLNHNNYGFDKTDFEKIIRELENLKVLVLNEIDEW